MLIDIDGLEDKVKPHMKDAKRSLTLARSTVASIDIPSDFSYRTKLKNIPDTIVDIYENIESIEEWVDTAINNFTNAESDNKGLIDNIVSALPTFITGGKAEEKGKDTVSILKANEYVKNLSDSVKNVFDYTFSGELITDSANMAKKTASKVVDTVESTFSWTVNTGAEIAEKAINGVSDKLDSGIDFASSKIESVIDSVGSGISDTWDFAYKSIVTPAWDVLKTTGATIANVDVGVLKGLCQFSESLTDAVVMLLTGVGSIATGAIDGGSYLAAWTLNDTENWSSITGKMWKSVMGYVAEDHVGNIFESFYSSTAVGQWLDEHAIEIFKSYGIGTNIASGIGYVAGIIGLTIGTMRNRNCCNWSSNCFINSCFVRNSGSCWNW